MSHSQQRNGLGKFLVDMLAAVARGCKMDMIMLTVLNGTSKEPHDTEQLMTLLSEYWSNQVLQSDRV